MSQVFARNGNSTTLPEIYQQDKHSTIPDESLKDNAHVRHVHLVILGTGFSGLGIAIRGDNFSLVTLES